MYLKWYVILYYVYSLYTAAVSPLCASFIQFTFLWEYYILYYYIVVLFKMVYVIAIDLMTLCMFSIRTVSHVGSGAVRIGQGPLHFLAGSRKRYTKPWLGLLGQVFSVLCVPGVCTFLFPCFLVVITSAINCPERHVSEMTCYYRVGC